MREIKDESGRVWRALAVESSVAHLRKGAELVFVPADEEGAEPVHAGVTFNSTRAAEFAINTMADKELSRRLNSARMEAGLI